MTGALVSAIRNPLDTSEHPKSWTALGAFTGSLLGAAPGFVLRRASGGGYGPMMLVGSIAGGGLGAYLLAPPDRKNRGTLGGAIGGVIGPVSAGIGGAIGARMPDAQYRSNPGSYPAQNPALTTWIVLASVAALGAGAATAVVIKRRKEEQMLAQEQAIFDEDGIVIDVDGLPEQAQAQTWRYQLLPISTAGQLQWYARVYDPAWDSYTIPASPSVSAVQSAAIAFITERGGIPVQHMGGPLPRRTIAHGGSTAVPKAIAPKGPIRTLIEAVTEPVVDDEPRDCIFYNGQFLCGGKKVEIVPSDAVTEKSINVLPPTTKESSSTGWKRVCFEGKGLLSRAGDNCPRTSNLKNFGYYEYNGWRYEIWMERVVKRGVQFLWRFALIGVRDPISGRLPPASGVTAGRWRISEDRAFAKAVESIEKSPYTVEMARRAAQAAQDAA